VRMISVSAAGLLLPTQPSRGQSSDESPRMLSRGIPCSGEKLPVIGLGTWRAFDIDASGGEQRPLQDVLTTFVKLGGRVIDSSPMYGRAEEVIGELVAKLGLRNSVFLATKVLDARKIKWHRFDGTIACPTTKTINLMQVHNLEQTPTFLNLSQVNTT